MTLDRYLVKQFLPVLAAALSMFMMLILLIDLFLNLVKFLNAGAGIAQILEVSLYYIPKSFDYALPVGLLFASAYTLGDLYARNELITVLGSGISFGRFCGPILVLGLLFSLGAFFFEDHAVVPSLRIKNELSRNLLHTQREGRASDVVIKVNGGRLVYAADYFDSRSQTLAGVTIIELDDMGNLVSLLRSPRAEWNGNNWDLASPVLYRWLEGLLRTGPLEDPERYTEDPETFRRGSVEPEDLKAADAALLIKDLRRAGLPTAAAQTDYYHRFSFCAVSFVVIFLSITMSGRFSKNILLMSLLSSLGSAVIYYVIEMVTMMSAKVGLLPPLAGAWIPVLACIAAGCVLLRFSKT